MTYVLGTLFALFFLVRIISVFAHRRVDLTSPGGIAHRLTGGSRRHVIRIGANRFVWNPAVPTGADNRVNGPGTATYTLDPQGVVSLDFVPNRGEARHYSGPLPEGLSAADAAPSVMAIVAAPVGALIGLFALLIAGTSFNTAALTGIAAWVVVSAVMMATSQVIRTRAFAASR